MFLKSLNIPGSALTAEQYRLNIIAENLANIETTRKRLDENGKAVPYKRQTLIFQESQKTEKSFGDYLDDKLAGMKGMDRNYYGFLALKSQANVTKENNALYVKPDYVGSALNGVERQTSGDFVRNKYILHGDDINAQKYNDGVFVPKIIEDKTPGKLIYDPEHPDANEEGYVEMPNVETTQEMVDMMGASRAYEANVQVVNAMKAMASTALNIGR